MIEVIQNEKGKNMANKVISIKMDEADIERIKRYHALLIELGFVSKENLTLNAFLKHMLIDNLSLDFKKMCDAYSEYGDMPGCLNPESVGESKAVNLSNIYGFDEEEYQAYQKCFIDALYKAMKRGKQDAEEMQKLLGIGIEWTGGIMKTLEVFGEEDSLSAFWSNKVDERRELIERDSEKSEREYMRPVIEEADLSESMKNRITNKIDNWRKNDRMLRDSLRRW